MLLTEGTEKLRKVEIKTPMEYFKRQNEINNHFIKKIKEEADASEKKNLEYMHDRYEELGKKIKAKKATEEEVREYATLFNKLAAKTQLKYILGFSLVVGICSALFPVSQPMAGLAGAGAGMYANIKAKEKLKYQEKDVQKHLQKMEKYKYKFEENKSLYENSVLLSDVADLFE